jgi:hypothetical protein
MMTEPPQHENRLDLASGARLTILYFFDREQRWLFAYNYIGKKDPDTVPEVVNDVKLTAEYTKGLLASTLVLTRHVMQSLSEKHREEYAEYTRIYLQPGCQVDALKKVPGMHSEWLEALEEIMGQPKFAERATEGLKYQGCCCGHKHRLLADTDAQMLRDAGFLVENDTERV